MPADFYRQINEQLAVTQQEGLFKQERIITSAQQADIRIGAGGRDQLLRQ